MLFTNSSKNKILTDIYISTRKHEISNRNGRRLLRKSCSFTTNINIKDDLGAPNVGAVFSGSQVRQGQSQSRAWDCSEHAGAARSTRSLLGLVPLLSGAHPCQGQDCSHIFEITRTQLLLDAHGGVQERTQSGAAVTRLSPR